MFIFHTLNGRSFSASQPGWQLCGSLGNSLFLSSSSWLSGLWKTSLYPASLTQAFGICYLPINNRSVYLWKILFLLSFSQPSVSHCWAPCECWGTPLGSHDLHLQLAGHTREHPEWFEGISLNSLFPPTSFNIVLPRTCLGL